MSGLIIAVLLFFAAGIYFLTGSRKLRVKALGLFFILAASTGIFAYLNLRNYTAFTNEELAARARVIKKPFQEKDVIELEFTPLKNNSSGNPDTYLLKGNQWMVEADILKWHPAMNLLGLKTGYKITRISGRYLSGEKQSRARQTVYTINGGTDRLWIFLHKYQNFLPFVEAVYGNSAYAFAEYGRESGVYVTISGLIIKKIQ